MSASTRSARQNLSALAGTLGTTRLAALGLGAVLGGVVVAGLTSSVKEAARFNAALTESTAILGDLSDALRDDLADAARQVARETTFSAEAAAEALFFLASAGLSAKESIVALPVVAQFAQAGMFDLATATDILTDAASALGLEMSELVGLSDMLVRGNTLVNASVEQLGVSLITKAAPAARRLGVDTAELIAILGIFANQGLKGQRAGTILARTLDGLASQAIKNADEFEQLGVEVFDANGEMRGIADIIADLEVALAGMSTEQRQATLEMLGFNERTAQGIDLLVGQSDELRNLTGELEKAGGTTEEVADKQLESFNAQVKLLDSNITDLKISLGTALLPTLIDVVQALNEGIDALRELNKEADRLGLGFSPIGLAAGGITTTARNAGFRTESVEFAGRQVQVIRFEGDGPISDLFAEQANQQIRERELRADAIGG